MSAETERGDAIMQGGQIFADACAAPIHPKRVALGMAALLDNGWIPPAQRDEELRQMAEWQRDARRAFEAVERIADATEQLWHPLARNLASQLREALGERFTSTEVAP